ncbi:hypothetical protein NM688_g2745 [Phlebia brevispora]|uniref:Uncharacterized protein n=1 Tax=Phlebia brevispora TaxID=194682 RepID=A0ACC1T7I6_9APHY|nr:hypothetical protein NM688_g2745 [Phlebia brevispora]
MDYFTCENSPLLSDCSKDTGEFHHIEIIDVHKDVLGNFEVAEFPETPLLTPASSDEEFSEFIQSPTSEEPPALKAKVAANKTTAEQITVESTPPLYSMEYPQHVAIILFVQILIPIPFMLPMGFSFAKHALKLFVTGFAVGIVGHGLFNALQTIPLVGPFGPRPVAHLAQSAFSIDGILPLFFIQLKLSAMGGAAVGALMAHVLNFFFIGHSVCRLARGLDPEPSAMRAMGSSPTFQRLQQLSLDLATGIFMMPTGLVLRGWWLNLWGSLATPVAIPRWHAALLGATAVAIVQICTRIDWAPKSPEKYDPTDKTRSMSMIEVQSELISF